MRNLVVIIVVFLFCTLFFEVGCRYLAKTDYRPSAQHLWDANLIQWESFLFPDDNRIPESVLVGTSLSVRMGDRFLLTASSKNLSFSGGGPITVLKLLSAMDKPPENIVIEMNYIDKPVSMSIIRRYSSPLTIFLKKNLLIWRVKYKPITVVKTFSGPFIIKLKEIERSYKAGIDNTGSKAIPKQKIVVQGEKILTVNLEKQRQYYAKPPQFSKDIIMELILHLKEKGSNIFLLNMPVHSSLYSTTRMVEVVKFQESIVEKTGAKLIQIYNNNNTYKTSDGLHLKPSSVNGVRNIVINNLLGDSPKKY